MSSWLGLTNDRIFLLNFVPQSAAKLHDMLLNTVLRYELEVGHVLARC